MEPSRPSLDLLRQLSDQHVLAALIQQPQLTRAQIATMAGLSKPTVGESMRRLVRSGVVRDTGVVTSGRGRAGTLFALADDIGVALAIDIAPGGIRAEAVDVYGRVVATTVEALDRPATPTSVGFALQRASRAVAVGAEVRLAVVSAADPVDRHSGRLVHLPDAPFLLGELSPAAVLEPVVAGPVIVDNDVHWAARAERSAAPGRLDNFAYLYLDEGLGCALVIEGEVLRGAGGLAGEVAPVLTRGITGSAVPFTEVFAQMGLRQHASTAIDVAATVLAIEDSSATGDAPRPLDQLADAISGALVAILALADPEVVVLGGSWGSHPRLLAAVTDAFASMPRHVPLQPAAVTEHPSLAGARHDALNRLRAWVTARGPAQTRPDRVSDDAPRTESTGAQ
jgi:predicted NBD/HSP70 family sugar kinase